MVCYNMSMKTESMIPHNKEFRVFLVSVMNWNDMGRTRSWALFCRLVYSWNGTHSFPPNEYSAQIRNAAIPPNQRNHAEPVAHSSPSLVRRLSSSLFLPRSAPPGLLLQSASPATPTASSRWRCSPLRSQPPWQIGRAHV